MTGPKKLHRPRPPRAPVFKVGCPFCWEWVPPATTHLNVFNGEGALGGQCAECGAYFVLDETGKRGGQALLDVQALACGGDLDRALELREGPDFELQTREIEASANTVSRLRGPAYLRPKAWFLKLKTPPSSG